MMGPYEFGAELIKTKDLDPVYVVVYGAKLPPESLRKWLLAYWCFYDAGTACKITDHTNYWGEFQIAAQSPGNAKYPRGRERRHFRGKNAMDSYEWLFEKGIDRLFQPFDCPRLVQQVMAYVQTWKGFGPWISFKVADMLERLKVCEVRFDNSAALLFDSPREGADKMWDWYLENRNGEATSFLPASKGSWALDELSKRLGTDYNAPPDFNRRVGYQEAETVLCKWKAYTEGKYHIGEDIKGLRRSLLKFACIPLAQRMLRAGNGEIW